MAPRPAAIGALLGLVLLSSVLGLQGHMVIWRASLAADLVFTAGTMLVGWGQAVAARHGPAGAAASVAGGFVAHWMVYAMSWSLVLATEGLLHLAFDFVLRVGWMGLLAAAAAPATVVLMAQARQRQQAAPA